MSKKSEQMQAEWSVFFDVSELGDKPKNLKLSAGEQECRDLARRFGITAAKDLSADIVISKVRAGQVIKVAGTLKASVEQECVVSAEPVYSDIEESFEGWFADPGAVVSIEKARREKAMKDGTEVQVLAEEDDPESFLPGGLIDVGELVAQHLSLALEPYPHAEGVEFEGKSVSSEAADRAFENPFAKLAAWKDSFKKNEE
jgi:uncharacterized metal-binding protein YceD (DUF177 family)